MAKTKADTRPFKTHVSFHRVDTVGNVVETLTLGPEDERPDWVLEQLGTGDKDHLFAGGPQQGEAVRAENDPQRLPSQELDAGDAQESAGSFQSGDIVEGEAPPKGGIGSGKEAWIAYAEQNGLRVPEDLNRDEVVEFVEKSGLPT